MAKAAIFLLNKNIEKPNKTNEPPQQRDAAGQNNSPGRETDAPNNEGSSEDSAAKIIGRANYFPAVKKTSCERTPFKRQDNKTFVRASQTNAEQRGKKKLTFARASQRRRRRRRAAAAAKTTATEAAAAAKAAAKAADNGLRRRQEKRRRQGEGESKRCGNAFLFLCMYVAHVHVSVILRWREF